MRQAGWTLTEVLIVMAIVGILMMVAVPQFTQTLQNQQIKSAAEATLQGLNLARAEALRRNMPIRFQLVSDLTNSCTLSSTSLNWIVSLGSPASLCATAPAKSDDAAAATGSDPKIVQKFFAQELGKNATASGFQSNGSTAANTVTFTGLGRVSGTGLAWIDFKSTAGTCEHESGTMRCMRIIISTGGQAKLCDPKVTATTDPRYCA
jgi:type IV fimbrial biogenesis protein FimT